MYRFGFQRVEVRDACSGSLIEYLSARTAGIENAMRMCTVAIDSYWFMLDRVWFGLDRVWIGLDRAWIGLKLKWIGLGCN